MYHKSNTAKVLIPLGREKTIDRPTTKYIFGRQKRQPNVDLIQGAGQTSNVDLHLVDSLNCEKIDTPVMEPHRIIRIVMLLFYVIDTIYTLLTKNQSENNGALSGAEKKKQPNVDLHLAVGVPA